MDEWWAVLKNDADDRADDLAEINEWRERQQAEEAKQVQDRRNGISEYGGPLCERCKKETEEGYVPLYCSPLEGQESISCAALAGIISQSEHWKYAGVEPQWTQDWGPMRQEWKDAARKQWPSEASQGDFDEANTSDDISVKDHYGNPVIIPSLGRPITEEEEREYQDWESHRHHLEWAEEQRREQEAAQAEQKKWDALVAEAEELGTEIMPWEEEERDHDAIKRRLDAHRYEQAVWDANRSKYRKGEPMDMVWRLLKHG